MLEIWDVWCNGCIKPCHGLGWGSNPPCPAFIEKHVRISSERMKKRHQNGEVKYDTFTGKEHSEETKRLMSVKASEHISNKNSQFDTCWITKDDINKKIKNSDLLTFTNEGWRNIMLGSSNG